MRKIVLLCGLVLGLSLSATAQDLPRIDVFGGYSYVRVNFPGGSSGATFPGDTHINLNGGSGSAALYLGNRLGVVADIGGYKFSTVTVSGRDFNAEGNVISYLFGPRIRLGGEKITPFAQVLFGGAHAGDITSSSSPPCPTSAACTLTKSQNAFAMTAGGGVDVKVARHFSIRGQAEYLLTKFTDGVNDRQNNVRISAGIVIH
jgi:opacity protein-like surface antigen